METAAHRVTRYRHRNAAAAAAAAATIHSRSLARVHDYEDMEYNNQ